MPDEVTIKTTPPDLLKRMEKYPKQLDEEMKVTMGAALLEFQEKTPAYPPQPVGTPYRRTGVLGGSLGVAQGGGVSGTPDIKLIRKLGQGNYQGEFGSRLHYAKWVIGTQTQAWMHRGRWWRMKDVAKRAEPKIIKLFKELTEDLARFLEGRG
jgi:hypothetical protein